ncbi:uncharacterized protein Z518_05396 [Rhinocladiella mackenziei CBS 650.93]|uniref:Rhinocladiella mackenziei CBS 650.93 unplaced genomic scaffold supercont1.4, whole genome shotgun sequence n=1 Tax=Rhinocladiella mackenziei CBS 650.93 TaxID=1442369 RepID=A0A0D2IN39_9EURO|nr:uncharacterized protein Z518_05396 [Rhinocladiella mackenziei CBS 650.93]KIX04526.1 hypothetical protein Z518_05396 [Rhinocladiella mackenziei CBS 650.93]
MQASPPRTSQTTNPDLAFVNITHPQDIRDRQTQRKIRRHVMKDIGFARRRRSRTNQIIFNLTSEKPHSSKPESSKAVVSQQPPKPIRHITDLHSHQSSKLALSQLSSSGFPSPYANRNLFSRIASSRAQRLLSFLHKEDAPVCQTFRSLCFTIALADESAMYLALAESALDPEWQSSQPDSRENVHALQYYTASLRLVDKRLRNTSAVGNAIIGTVISLAAYDLRIHHFSRWAVHMAGLQGMIQSRGGVEALDWGNTREILSDLVGSLALDLSPQFPVCDRLMPQAHDYPASPVLARTISVLENRTPILSDICSVLVRLSYLKYLVAGNGPRQQTDKTLTQTLGLITHNLLSLPRRLILSDPGHPSTAHLVLREAIRLASLLFLTAPVGRVAGNRDLHAKHRGRLPKLLRSYHDITDWSDLEELEVWVLVVGAWAEVGEDRKWMVRRIKGVMRMKGLDWPGVLGVLRRIALIEGVWNNEVDRIGAEVAQMQSVSLNER